MQVQDNCYIDSGSDQAFQTLLATLTSEMIVVVDSKTQILDGTGAFATLLGYDRARLLGRDFGEILDRAEIDKLDVLHRDGAILSAVQVGLDLCTGEGDQLAVLARISWVNEHGQDLRIFEILSSEPVPNPDPGAINARMTVSAGSDDIQSHSASLITAVHRITEAITAIQDDEQLYPALHAAIRYAIPADSFLIARIADQTDTASAIYISGCDTPAENPIILPNRFQDRVTSAGSFIINAMDAEDRLLNESFGIQNVNTKAMLGVPLIAGNRTIGVIVVQSYEPEIYTEEHRWLFESFGRAIATTLDRQRLLNEYQSQIRQANQLRSVIKQVSAVLDPATVYDAAAKAILNSLDNSVVAIVTCNDGSESPTVRSIASACPDQSVDTPRLARSLIAANSIIRQAISLEKQLYQPDIAAEAGDANLYASAKNLFRSIIATPILTPEGCQGCICVGRAETDGFDEGEFAQLRTISALFGVLLKRAALFAEQQQNTVDLEALQRVSTIIASNLGVADILNEIVKLTPRLLEADSSTVSVVNGDELLRVAASGNPGSTFPDRIPIGSSEAGKMIRSGRPMFIYDLATFENTRENVRSKNIKARGWGAAPMLDADGNTFGALAVHTVAPKDWTQRHRYLLEALAAATSHAYQNARTFQDTQGLLKATVESLAAAVDAKDPHTHSHSRQVARYSRLIAEAMELEPSLVDQIELAGLLHDVGKIGIPDRILQKPGALTEVEWQEIKRHPEVGEHILSGNANLASILSLVRHHHERWDGSGYPDGLHGRDTPLGAAIIALADALDTMLSDRPYSERRTLEQVLNEIEMSAGTQFHPAVVASVLNEVRAGRLVLETARPSVETGSLMTNIEQTIASLDARSLVIFHQIAQEIRNLKDIDTLATNLVQILEENLDDIVVSICRLDEHSNDLIQLGERDLVNRTTSSAELEGIRRVLTTGRPETIHGNDIRGKEQQGLPGTSAVLYIPILTDDDIIGMLCVESRQAQTVIESDERLLISVAGHLAHMFQAVDIHSEYQRLSLIDPLTSVGNHRAFYEALARNIELAAESETNVAVIIFDVSNLKVINDTLGHLAGDEVLRNIAATLQSGSRQRDLVCRYGGDEFAIILPATSRNTATRIARRLTKTQVESRFWLDDKDYSSPGVEWGVAVYPTDGERSTELVAAADQRMYLDKQRAQLLEPDPNELVDDLEKQHAKPD